MFPYYLIPLRTLALFNSTLFIEILNTHRIGFWLFMVFDVTRIFRLPVQFVDDVHYNYDQHADAPDAEACVESIIAFAIEFELTRMRGSDRD